MILTANPVEAVKKAALEAVEASKPVSVLFGTVISASPLKIQIDQKTIYTQAMLVLTRHVTAYDSRHTSLAVGERVVLIRLQGGKRLLVLDRLTD